jgi:hypothetical protein
MNDAPQPKPDNKEPIKETVERITAELGETERKPRRQIFEVVERGGVEFAENLLKETLEIEAAGGMMIEKGERRRTKGGVFFYLARKHLPPEIRDDIFHPWRAAIRERNEHEAQFPTFEWDSRTADLEAVLALESGKASEVKISMIGRPGEVERRQDLIITHMDYQANEPFSLPRGVPEPPTDPMTYVVYISAKQWERVEKALENPEDEMLLDGMCAFDPEVNGMAVFATFVTTRNLQRQDKKQARREAMAASKKAGPPRDAKSKPTKPAGSASKTRERAPEPEIPELDIKLPDGIPSGVAQKLTELHTAAARFRLKIETLETKPPDQQTGLAMTRRLLDTTEKQIETIERQYADKV